MQPPEELIRKGGATLAFDTNAILGFSKVERRLELKGFFGICNAVDRLRADLSSPLPMAIVVPSLVRMEGLHDLRIDRAKRSDPFDEKELKAKGFEVAPFDERAAIDASGALHQWFPSHEEWQTAKRHRCLEILGLQGTDPPGKAGLASIDWAIAAQAEAQQWILVTADSHAEFRKVSLKIRKTELRALLDALLYERRLR